MISRRAFLGLASGVAGTLALQRLPWPSFASKGGSILDDARSIALSTAWASARLQPPAIHTLAEAYAFEREYVPHLEADGIIPPMKGVYPQIRSVDFETAFGAQGNFHIEGTSDCAGAGTVSLNGRFFAPDAAWYGRTGWIASTLAHELGHSNGRDCELLGESAEGEAMTQVIAMNTLASWAMEAQTNRENGPRLALAGFLALLNEFADGYVLSHCLTGPGPTPTPTFPSSDGYGLELNHVNPTPRPFAEGAPQLARYIAFCGQCPYPAQKQAGASRMFDYWRQAGWGTFLDIVEKYDVRPFEATYRGLTHTDHLSEALPYGSEPGDMSSKRIDLSSTRYVLGHLKELVP